MHHTARRRHQRDRASTHLALLLLLLLLCRVALFSYRHSTRLHVRVHNTAVEDRVHKFRQSPITNVNHEDTSTNVRSMRSAITVMAIYNGWRSGHEVRTRQGEKSLRIRRRTRTLTVSISYLLARREGDSWRHLLATYHGRERARQGLGQSRPKRRH